MRQTALHKNLLVLKLPRTGSTYLAHLLRQHPQISFHHDYLNVHASRQAQLLSGPLGMRGVRRITRMVLRRAKWRDLARLLATSSAKGITGASIDPYKERLAEPALRRIVNPETRIVVLTRENLLKQRISQLNVEAEKSAGTERLYERYNDEGKVTDRKFHLGPDAVAEIEALDRQRAGLLSMVEALDVPRLYLTYEAHINVEDKQPLLELLAEFVDVPLPDDWRVDARPQPDVPRYHKLVSDDLRAVIENYDEIAANAAMAKFL
jgi:hypothetical protein